MVKAHKKATIKLPIRKLFFNHFFGKTDLLSSSFASNFFRTEILKRTKLKTNLNSGDNEIRLRIASSQPILLIQGWVTWPRETPGQASSKIDKVSATIEHDRFAVEILQDNAYILPPLLVSNIQSMLKRKAVLLGVNQLRQGNLLNTLKLFRQNNLNISDIIKCLKFKPDFQDFLNDYTPSSPLKRGFMDRAC